MTCKSGAPTLDGSKFSNTRRTNSSIGRVERDLTLKAARILKVTQLEFGVTITAKPNNGKLSILIKIKESKRKE
jgi:hypothetical protein